MKPANIGCTVLLILSLGGLLLSFFLSFVDFSVSMAILAFLFTAGAILLIVAEVKSKKHELRGFLPIFTMCFFATSALMKVFWTEPLTMQNNLPVIPQTLGFVSLGIWHLLGLKEARKATEKFKTEFDKYFKVWDITFPPEKLDKRKAGTINKAGWLINFRFGREGSQEFVEVYAVHPDARHRHFQILTSGEIKNLPTLDNLKGVREEELIAELKRKELYSATFNSWLVSYITHYRRSKSRYEIDKFLLDLGYSPSEIGRTWESVAPQA